MKTILHCVFGVMFGLAGLLLVAAVLPRTLFDFIMRMQQQDRLITESKKRGVRSSKSKTH